MGMPWERSEGGQEVPFLFARRAMHPGVVGRPLHAVVPRAVVVVAVAVLLAVRLVVLLVVRDEVGQGEAVVAGDEVDAGEGPAARALVEVEEPVIR